MAIRELTAIEIESVAGGNAVDKAIEAAKDVANKIKEAMKDAAEEIGDTARHFNAMWGADNVCGDSGVASVGKDGAVTCK